MMIVNWCCMFKTGGESVDHLLLHCMVARDIVTCMGVIWSIMGHVEDGGANALLFERDFSKPL